METGYSSDRVSAWGPEADRRGKPWQLLLLGGKNRGADPHLDREGARRQSAHEAFDPSRSAG